MNKRVITVTIVLLGLGIITLLFGLILLTMLAYDRDLANDLGIRNPGYISSYPETGYFKINPDTILESLTKGRTDVFTPLLEEPYADESLTNGSSFWTQADFLKVIKALGVLIWNDPMELTEWRIYDIAFERDCHDGPAGFDSAEFTFFKTIVVNGRKVYTTRYIAINPYYSMVSWGSGATYPQPILHKWIDFNETGINFTADYALRISEENGGEEARQNINNRCSIMTGPSLNNDKWFVNYISPDIDFSALIDPRTGEYRISSANK